MPQTVVKANYVRAGDGGAKVKASARYYAHRPDQEGERVYRAAFNKEHDALSKEEMYDHLDTADEAHTYHYRMVLAPGAEADADGGDLKTWTREVMDDLEAQHSGKLSWVAVEHAYEDAHTDHAHVHVIASTDRTLTREELRTLRERGTQHWEEQMDEQRALERDPMQHETTDVGREARHELATARTSTLEKEPSWER